MTHSKSSELTENLDLSEVSKLSEWSLGSRLRTVRKSLKNLSSDWPPDPEAVHQLRVATRRATATLKLFQDLLAKKDFRWWRKRLRTWRRAAGEVRNSDILIEFLESWNGSPLENPTDRDSILGVVRVQQAHARVELRKVIQQLDFSRLKRRQEKLLGRLSRPSSSSRVSGTLKKGREKGLAEWSSRQLSPVYERFVQARPRGQCDEAGLHQFRIAGKQLRYTLELLSDTLPHPESKRVLKSIGQLQDRLGRLNDLTTLDLLLRECFLLEGEETGNEKSMAGESKEGKTGVGKSEEGESGKGMSSKDKSDKDKSGKQKPGADPDTVPDIPGQLRMPPDQPSEVTAEFLAGMCTKVLAILGDLAASRQVERQRFLEWWSGEGSEICHSLDNLARAPRS